MTIHGRLIDISLRFPRTVMWTAVVVALGLTSLLPRIVIDTDPENMLPADQQDRVFHDLVKKDFDLHDLLVVGVVNDTDPDGVFNPATLARVHELTDEILQIDGVVRQDVLSLATVDNISQGGPGVVRFEWMMADPPASREDAQAIGAAARRLPTVQGTVVSEDGVAAGIYVPLTDKNQSHRVAAAIEEIVARYEGDEKYFITGLPVAEDTFGFEMFRQMGMAAPLAGLIIFLLLWVFFRSVALILSPMIVAIMTVASTMGLLIGTGFTVHIMSSMIPIFLMPIAVVDSVHILSEFADRYPQVGDRKKTIRMVMGDLFTPMLYTSLTSAAGFASLAFAPIPPVRVFGVFVAIGITIAFVLTVTFIPAYIVRLSDKRISKLSRRGAGQQDRGVLAGLLHGLGPRTIAGSRLIIVATVVVLVVSAVGIAGIEINDNPVRWFRPDHRIRVADRVLNRHFSGTYESFLVLEKPERPDDHEALRREVASLLVRAEGDEGALARQWNELHSAAAAAPLGKHLDDLVDAVLATIDEEPLDDEVLVWEAVLASIEEAQTRYKYFQTPQALEFVEGLQTAMAQIDLVGKSTSVVDIVKTVHRELREGDEAYYSVPRTPEAVAQTLLTYQSSHRPDDLWHFLTPDLRRANIWMQLKSGDNQDMVAVVEHVDRYLAAHPPPEGVTVGWAGMTYLNVVWQDAMVRGMLKALLGSFVIVFVMMLILFRSLWFGLLAMLPLTVTITFIYGLIGLVGKDYDMPVAVLSSLTLGLSIDFAIHYLQRIRVILKETGSWPETIRRMFSAPARAISRNAIVIAIGFLPLLASPLVPYNTVGVFLSLIMMVSCAVTLVLLPGVMNVFGRRWLARVTSSGMSAANGSAGDTMAQEKG
ncbi:MAG: MMPL family transporter [Candidatus Krumholzibacteria bacterium]